MPADEGPALNIDPNQRIVNVQWAGGLAVEFGDKAADAPKPPDEPEPA